MPTVNIQKAKTHFCRLLQRVSLGDEIIIARAGRPIAKLVPYRAAKKGPRVPDTQRGKIWISDDFQEFKSDLQKDFETDENHGSLF